MSTQDNDIKAQISDDLVHAADAAGDDDWKTAEKALLDALGLVRRANGGRTDADER